MSVPRNGDTEPPPPPRRRLIVDTPQLPPNPTTLDLARAYANVTLRFVPRLEAVLEEIFERLDEHDQRTIEAITAAQAAIVEAFETREKVDKIIAEPREKMPSAHEYGEEAAEAFVEKIEKTNPHILAPRSSSDPVPKVKAWAFQSIGKGVAQIALWLAKYGGPVILGWLLHHLFWK